MKAQKLLQSAVLQPDRLNLVYGAFDAAWNEIKAHYHTPMSIEAAPLSLANAVLAAYRDGLTDTHALKAAGLAVMRGPQT
jgi:hypothetical protein